MYRVLKDNKYLCLILGNTEYKGVKIPNVEISSKMLEDIGFKIKNIVKRKLSSKIFTPYRNKEGKFISPKKGRRKNIYQYEYIVVAKKVNL
jgi:hypothetical protein